MSTNKLWDVFCFGHEDLFGDFGANRDKTKRDKTWFVKSSKSFEGQPLSKEALIEHQFDSIAVTFGLEKSEEHIRALFRSAVSGSGNEWLEISQLNSSSLLAFLCFHRISPERPIRIEGVGVFDRVYFEIKSPLPAEGRSRPKSNMDIVLVSAETALFLESKFTEYGNQVQSLSLKPYYKKRYSELCLSKIGDIDYIPSENVLRSSNGKHYLEGLKQMICHYIGIANSKEVKPQSWKCDEIDLSSKKIVLAEIVYKFDNELFVDYQNIQEQLGAVLRSRDKSGITVVDKLLTYQSVFGANQDLLTDAVAKFYGIGKFQR